MLHISQTVLVEGKYDKIRLSNIIDANIITTGGFDIFGDEKKRKMLKRLAEKTGLLVLTDSDRSGFKIRGHISGFLPKENVIHLYIPKTEGKEARKAEFSAEGLLGVEGIDDEVLYRLFLPFADNSPKKHSFITKAQLYELGLFGRSNSKKLRYELCKKLDLPENINAGALADALGIMFSKEEVESAIGSLSKESEN